MIDQLIRSIAENLVVQVLCEIEAETQVKRHRMRDPSATIPDGIMADIFI